MTGEELVLVVHLDQGTCETPRLGEEIARSNSRLPHYKRVSGYLLWDKDFPVTASLKVKRGELAEQIRQGAGREKVAKL